jgi:hypothetical protein
MSTVIDMLTQQLLHIDTEIAELQKAKTSLTGAIAVMQGNKLATTGVKRAYRKTGMHKKAALVVPAPDYTKKRARRKKHRLKENSRIKLSVDFIREAQGKPINVHDIVAALGDHKSEGGTQPVKTLGTMLHHVKRRGVPIQYDGKNMWRWVGPAQSAQ